MSDGNPSIKRPSVDASQRGATKLVPIPDEASQPFFDGAREHRLMIQQCTSCGAVMWPVKSRCNNCLNATVSWVQASGKGTLYSFALMHQVYPGFATERYRIAQAKEHETSSDVVSPLSIDTMGVGSWSEYQARAFLEEHDIPVIPTTLATSADQAVEAAQAMGFPIALKIASPDIVHKSDIGGVKLGLQYEEEVSNAFTQVMNSTLTITPTPHIEGALVSPMRNGGTELLVGITRDATWGQVLAVGMGGIWVEMLKDTSLRVLPVTREDVRTMLTELQGAKLLQGARDSKPADMDALVDVIYCVAKLAESLKADLESLEINPLQVDGSQIEALDAVITWRGS